MWCKPIKPHWSYTLSFRSWSYSSSRVCQHLIRNCDKTRLRKKAGLAEDEEGGEGEEQPAKEWTQARNLDEDVERGEEKDGEVEREVEKEGEGEEDGEVEREEPKIEEDPWRRIGRGPFGQIFMKMEQAYAICDSNKNKEKLSLVVRPYHQEQFSVELSAWNTLTAWWYDFTQFIHVH